MSEEKRDPKRVIELRSAAGPISFSMLWDEIEFLRAIESRTRSLDLKNAPPAVSAEVISGQCDGRGEPLPVTLALARETLIHFKKTAPAALKAEFDRLVMAAFLTAAKALADYVQRNRTPGAPVKLPNDAVADPRHVMASRELTDHRNRLISVAADAARETHPKSSNRPKGATDDHGHGRGKRRKENEEKLLSEMKGEMKRRHGAVTDPGARKQEFSRNSPRRAAKSAVHHRLAERDGVTPDAIKKRRLRATSKRKN